MHLNEENFVYSNLSVACSLLSAFARCCALCLSYVLAFVIPSPRLNFCIMHAEIFWWMYVLMRCLSLDKDMSAVDSCRCHETALGWASVSCWHFNCNTQCSTLPVTSDKRRRSRTVQFAGRWSRDRWLISVVYSSPAPLLSTSPSSPIILYCRLILKTAVYP